MSILLKKLSVILLVFSAVSASAQSALKINEIMVNNQTNCIDSYGNKSSWIEIYNSSGSTVNIGGCYLSNDPNNLKKYRITKGDRITVIAPRQFLVFRAGSNESQGTLFTNFKLDPDSENTVYLSDTEGKLIDKMVVPATVAHLPDNSYGRLKDGGDDLGILSKPSPNINNLEVNQDAANEKFKQNDPYGLIMSMIAVFVVFCALALLVICLKFWGKYILKLIIKKSKKDFKTQENMNAQVKNEGMISGETVAAIAASIYQMQNSAHDVENAILTIERQATLYSPWSSKIYTLRQTPQLRNIKN